MKGTSQQKRLFSMPKLPPNIVNPSPYEARKNYKVLKDFFGVQIMNQNVPTYAMVHEPRYFQVKESSKITSTPMKAKAFNRFDKNNVFNKYQFMQTNTSKSNEDLNTELKSKAGSLPPPEYRAKSSVGGFRTAGSNFAVVQEVLSKPDTSPKSHRRKIKPRGKNNPLRN